MSLHDHPAFALARQAEKPFEPIRSTEDLLDKYAREALPAIRQAHTEYDELVEREGPQPTCQHGTLLDDPEYVCTACKLDIGDEDLARDDAEARLDLSRLKAREDILTMLSSDWVLIFNDHELKLLGQVVESLDQRR